MVENPITLAIDAAPEHFTTTTTFVLAYLYERGEAVRPEVEDALEIAQPTASRALREAVDAGLARETEGPATGTRGRNPPLFVATPPGDNGETELNRRELKDRVVEVLARLHYRQHVSAANNKRIRRELPDGVTPQILAAVLRDLGGNGVVEKLTDRSSNNYYRLTGAGEHVTFRAGRAEA